MPHRFLIPTPFCAEYAILIEFWGFLCDNET